MLKKTFAVSLAVTLLAVAKDGSTQPITDKPDLRPGDAWQFLRTNTKDGKTDRWKRTIEAIESPDRIAVRAGGATAYYD